MGTHLALAFRQALRRVVVADEPTWSVEGLESVVSNDVMLTAAWPKVSDWFWRRSPHINVLEVSAAVKVLEKHGLDFPHSRFVSFLDSAVARGALAKGRSTSRLLQPLLRRAAVFQVGFDLYPVWPFCPTRLNVADDPTRDVPLRKPVAASIKSLQGIDSRALHRTGLKRSAANWVRLFILSLSTWGCEALPPVFPLEPSLARFGLHWPCLHGFFISLSLWIWSIFGLSLGFFSLLWLLRWRCGRVLCWIWFLFVLPGLAPSVPPVGLLPGALAMEPTSVAEKKRAEARARTSLTGDRVALDLTRGRRKRLLRMFQIWLWQEKGVSLLFLLRERPADPEKIAAWLCVYGNELFRSGKAYGIFAETINSVASARPQIRKQLAAAWDLAFSWLHDEPFGHHPAMPASVLLSLLSVCLIWGWVREAAVFGLAWAGILRIGEVLQARRGDLVLPRDAAPGTAYALLKIREPKTRGRHARHQAARVDPVDIIQLLDLAFSKCGPQAPLWPMSASTLRKRLDALMRAAKLPTGNEKAGVRPFDLSSFRPGGASHLLSAVED